MVWFEQLGTRGLFLFGANFKLKIMMENLMNFHGFFNFIFSRIKKKIRSGFFVSEFDFFVLISLKICSV
jgi:hypothetical protein